MNNQNELSWSEEEFIKEFGCDRETYDKKLCENEARILREREKIYKNYPYSFIGKKLTYKSKYYQRIEFKNMLITDIRVATGYPEHFDTYYSLYTTNENGKEKWLINLQEQDFENDNCSWE